MLKEGVATFAQLTKHVARLSKLEGNHHDYTFEYMDETAHPRTITLTSSGSKTPEYTEDEVKRILYTPDGQVLFFDDVRYMNISEEGLLKTPPIYIVLGAVGPLFCLVALLILLFG